MSFPSERYPLEVAMRSILSAAPVFFAVLFVLTVLSAVDSIVELIVRGL